MGSCFCKPVMQGCYLSPVEAIHAAKSARTVAVLGIKPDSKASQPGYYVPRAIQAAGVRVIPVPVLQGFDEVLGEPVQRDLRLLTEPIDILDVFRPGPALPAHLADILAMRHRPSLIWLQVGIRNDSFEKEVLKHGIDLVVDRCLMVDLQQGSKL